MIYAYHAIYMTFNYSYGPKIRVCMQNIPLEMALMKTLMFSARGKINAVVASSGSLAKAPTQIRKKVSLLPPLFTGCFSCGFRSNIEKCFCKLLNYAGTGSPLVVAMFVYGPILFQAQS